MQRLLYRYVLYLQMYWLKEISDLFGVCNMIDKKEDLYMYI